MENNIFLKYINIKKRNQEKPHKIDTPLMWTINHLRNSMSKIQQDQIVN
jgi:hypothetical protein